MDSEQYANRHNEIRKADFIPMTPAMRQRLTEMELVKKAFIDGYLTAFGAEGEWHMLADASGWTTVKKAPQGKQDGVC